MERRDAVRVPAIGPHMEIVGREVYILKKRRITQKHYIPDDDILD